KDFSRYTRRFTFAEDIPPMLTALIKEFSNELSGVKIVERSKRTYISGDVASHLLGSVGPIYAEEAKNYTSDKGYLQTDIVGKDGIEKAMEDQLRGRYGTKTVIEDSRGNIVEEIDSVEPVAGKTVQLTLDYKFQKEVQQILADYIADFNKSNKEGKKSPAASIVVLDTKNNGVLASVSYPYYNIDDYKTKYAELSKDPAKPLFNRAFNGSYAPGSTFKPIVATAGLVEKKATVNSTVSCRKVYTYFGTSETAYKPKCFTGPHGNISVTEAIHHSCNIYFYDVGRILGINKINQYAEYFGMGVDTGIEIGAKKGHLSTPEYSQSIGERWEAGNVVQAAIGQGYIQISPLQMATEAATLANKGKRFQTHIVKSVLSNDQKKVDIPETNKVMSQFEMADEYFQAIKKGMIEVGAGFSSLKNLPYQVAVKTGTPQVTVTKFNSSFIAFAPAENPEIAISCIVENGQNCGSVLTGKVIEAYERSKKPPTAPVTPTPPPVPVKP
ncbi:MAG: penicillin-binding transpeptidase domain-containing protein, partial [Oscillospiraceae bacterium]